MSDDYVLEHNTFTPNKTFGATVQWYYEEKWRWYDDNGFYIVSDEEYAADAAPKQENVQADTRTDGPSQTAAVQQIRDNANFTAPPDFRFRRESLQPR